MFYYFSKPLVNFINSVVCSSVGNRTGYYGYGNSLNDQSDCKISTYYFRPSSYIVCTIFFPIKYISVSLDVSFLSINVLPGGAFLFK
jgi:hypothetical protein